MARANTQQINRDEMSEVNELRGSRGAENRANERIELTDEERIRIMEGSDYNQILPNIRNDGEWHYCWLTTANALDHVEKRKLAGYQIVTWSDMPELSHLNTNKEDNGKEIKINELVLGRIKKSLYQQYMHSVHGTKPLRNMSTMDKAAQVNSNLQAMQSGRGVSLGNEQPGHILPPTAHSLIRENAGAPDGFKKMAEMAYMNPKTEFPD